MTAAALLWSEAVLIWFFLLLKQNTVLADNNILQLSLPKYIIQVGVKLYKCKALIKLIPEPCFTLLLKAAMEYGCHIRSGALL